MAWKGIGTEENQEILKARVGQNTDAASTTTIFARLKQIYDYLTGDLSSTRVAKLDNLDALVSSRMPGTTTHRDRIDVAVSSRLASNDTRIAAMTPTCVAPSDTIRLSSDAVRKNTDSGCTVFKAFTVNVSGVVRVTGEARRVPESGQGGVYVSLHKASITDMDGTTTKNSNNATMGTTTRPVSTEQIFYTPWSSFTIDLPVSIGETVFVVLRSNACVGEIKNVRVKWDEVAGTRGAFIQDEIVTSW